MKNLFRITHFDAIRLIWIQSDEIVSKKMFQRIRIDAFRLIWSQSDEIYFWRFYFNKLDLGEKLFLMNSFQLIRFNRFRLIWIHSDEIISKKMFQRIRIDAFRLKWIRSDEIYFWRFCFIEYDFNEKFSMKNSFQRTYFDAIRLN